MSTSNSSSMMHSPTTFAGFVGGDVGKEETEGCFSDLRGPLRAAIVSGNDNKGFEAEPSKPKKDAYLCTLASRHAVNCSCGRSQLSQVANSVYN